MNTTTNQNQTPPPQPPKIPAHFVLEPIPGETSPALVIESLLKYPGRIVHELQNNWRVALFAWLLLVVLFGMTAYGLVVGSFSGGAQIWIAPAKIVLGTVFSILICLPSLYIFTCLSGIDVRVRTMIGVFLAAVGLSALLLIGFAPVAWIFSQSTDSIAFMGMLHIGIWAIGIIFGLRLIQAMGVLFSKSAQIHLKLWSVIFVAVCLQMITALRPIVGTSDHFLPGEKKFFLAHWMETMFQQNQEKGKRGSSR